MVQMGAKLTINVSYVEFEKYKGEKVGKFMATGKISCLVANTKSGLLYKVYGYKNLLTSNWYWYRRNVNWVDLRKVL